MSSPWTRLVPVITRVTSKNVRGRALPPADANRTLRGLLAWISSRSRCRCVSTLGFQMHCICFCFPVQSLQLLHYMYYNNVAHPGPKHKQWCSSFSSSEFPVVRFDESEPHPPFSHVSIFILSLFVFFVFFFPPSHCLSWGFVRTLVFLACLDNFLEMS